MGNIFYQNKSEILIINTSSNKPIKNTNINIKKIKFHSRCVGNPHLLLDNNYTVETIDLSHKPLIIQLENLPPKLENLYLSCSHSNIVYNFPKYLKILKCSDYFYFNQINIANNIQNTLKKLILIQSGSVQCSKYIQESIFFPEDLEELYFNYEDEYEPKQDEFEYLIKIFDNLPQNLKILKLPSFLNIELKNLPLKLEKLYIGIKYNQNLDSLPESVKFIEFVEQMYFNKQLDNLPSQLEYLNLQFQNSYNYTISNLPNSLKILELGEYKLKIDKLPTNLTELRIASPVKFIEYTFDIDDINDMINLQNTQIIQIKRIKRNKQIKYYKLEEIGDYNIRNNIKIQIPQNLSIIQWWDGSSSVYTYKKSAISDILWYEILE